MKNILSMTILLLGNQIAFGMYNGTVKTILNSSEINTIGYDKSDTYKDYEATLKNSPDLITARFFVAGPKQGNYECYRIIQGDKGTSNLAKLDSKIYAKLRTLYKAQKAFGMDTEANNPTMQLDTTFAALALNISTNELRQLQKVNESEIRQISYTESGNTKSYYATLNNCDTISASFFVAGPAKGSFICNRRQKDKYGYYILIPLNNDTYDQLRNLHEAQSH